MDQDAPGLLAIGLVRRHGAAAVDDACRRALDTEVIDVGLIDRMSPAAPASSYHSCLHHRQRRRHGSSAPATISPSGGHHEPGSP